MTAIKNMSSGQIEARLAELEALELRHSRRDLDAELNRALLEGADVDALEIEQLESERKARRFRVERQALQKALRMAKAREGEATITELRVEHEELRPQAEQVRDELFAAVAALEDAANRWTELRKQGSVLGQQARQIASITGAQGQRFGVFTSAGVAKAINALREIANHTHAEAGAGHPSTPLD